jgi:hypothetical protein
LAAIGTEAQRARQGKRCEGAAPRKILQLHSPMHVLSIRWECMLSPDAL